MGGKIQILPPEVVQKIAAGEVVERPASVLKELVENAIDAGATEVIAELEMGGRRRISVIDNGAGMLSEDAVVAFQHHATSKLRTPEDLNSIATLGFRGEALYSIAAVSRMELVTRMAEEITGTRVKVEGGEVKEIAVSGAPVGTKVEVIDLFYNTPARRKFLKSVNSELSFLSDVMTRFALSYPNITFKLFHHRRLLLDTAGEKTFEDRLLHLYGKEITSHLVPVNFANDIWQIYGSISKPTYSRTTRRGWLFFVNQRPVENRTITQALMDVYRSLLPTGRFPMAIILVKVSPALIDINVHPTKKEVRFQQEDKFRDFCREGVYQTLREKGLIPEISQTKWRIPAGLTPVTTYQAKQSSLSLKDFSSEKSFYQILLSRKAEEGEVLEKKEILPRAQVNKTYIICESDNELMIIDQHAAHERILYEKLIREEKISSQKLLLPVTLQLSPSESALLEKYQNFFRKKGFEIEPFGIRTYILQSVPAMFSHLDGQQLLRDTLDDFSEKERAHTFQDAEIELIATLACRGAVKGGQRLKMDEMNILIEQLLEITDRYTCPHGRPTMVKIPWSTLEKEFRRI